VAHPPRKRPRANPSDQAPEWSGGYAPRRMQFEVRVQHSVSCVGCGAERPLPPADRNRMPSPAENAADGVTVSTDTPCSCGANRVRIKLELE
jgi:hypothetical protein